MQNLPLSETSPEQSKNSLIKKKYDIPFHSLLLGNLAFFFRAMVIMHLDVDLPGSLLSLLFHFQCCVRCKLDELFVLLTAKQIFWVLEDNARVKTA